MPTDVQALLRLEVPLIVELGRRSLPVEDVMSLAPGSIIELGKPAEEALDVLVSNKIVGHGHAVKVGENFGVRLTSVGDPRRRLDAMTEPAEPAAP